MQQLPTDRTPGMQLLDKVKETQNVNAEGKQNPEIKQDHFWYGFHTSVFAVNGNLTRSSVRMEEKLQ